MSGKIAPMPSRSSWAAWMAEFVGCAVMLALGNGVVAMTM
jgi:glycerol uptake facilitator-like aquaporin